MGTDGCGSIEGTDMQNALYLSSLLHKLRGDYTGWSAPPIHSALPPWRRPGARTREGARAIEQGRIADLTAYDLHSLPFTPLNDPVHQLVCAACRHEVDFVMVDGESSCSTAD